MLSCVYLAGTIRICCYSGYCTVCDDLIVLSDEADDEDKENVRPDEDAYVEGRVLHLRYMYELNMEQRTRLIVKEILQGILLLIYKSGLSVVCLSSTHSSVRPICVHY